MSFEQINTISLLALEYMNNLHVLFHRMLSRIIEITSSGLAALLRVTKRSCSGIQGAVIILSKTRFQWTRESKNNVWGETDAISK